MTRELRYKSHARTVSLWLQKFPATLTQEEFVGAIEKVFDQALEKTQITISEVTLSAVLDRILYNSAVKFPILNELKLDGAKLKFASLKRHVKSSSNSEIKAAFLYFFTEFFFVIGNLTAEHLTPILYNELTNDLPRKSAQKGKKDTT